MSVTTQYSIGSFRALVQASGLEPRLIAGRMGYAYERFQAVLSGEAPVTAEFVEQANEVLSIPAAVFAPEGRRRRLGGPRLGHAVLSVGDGRAGARCRSVPQASDGLRCGRPWARP